LGKTPAFPPSPARLDRELDAQNNAIINVDWSLDRINLATDIQGQLPYANIQNVTGQRLLGRDSGTGIVQELIIGSNLTLTGGYAQRCYQRRRRLRRLQHEHEHERCQRDRAVLEHGRQAGQAQHWNGRMLID